MKDSNCAGFVNAFGAAFILVAFIVHPILALIVLILWIAGASLESRIREGKRISSPADDELLAARRRAIKIGVGLGAGVATVYVAFMLVIAATSGFPPLAH
jgi:hypothetical protein